MRLAIASAVTLLALAATTHALRAAVVSETISASATNFTVLGAPATPPVDPATITFSITFDNSTGLENQTVGLTLISNNLALDSGFGFTYRDGTDVLAVGGLSGNVVGSVADTNDFGWAFAGISTATPTLFNLFYETTSMPTSLFLSSTGTVTATPLATNIPEPGSVALLAGMLGSFVLAGAWRRRRNRSRGRWGSTA